MSESTDKSEAPPPDKEEEKQAAQISRRKEGVHGGRSGNRRRKMLDLDAIFEEVDRQAVPPGEIGDVGFQFRLHHP